MSLQFQSWVLSLTERYTQFSSITVPKEIKQGDVVSLTPHKIPRWWRHSETLPTRGRVVATPILNMQCIAQKCTRYVCYATEFTKADTTQHIHRSVTVTAFNRTNCNTVALWLWWLQLLCPAALAYIHILDMRLRICVHQPHFSVSIRNQQRSHCLATQDLNFKYSTLLPLHCRVQQCWCFN